MGGNEFRCERVWGSLSLKIYWAKGLMDVEAKGCTPPGTEHLTANP